MRTTGIWTALVAATIIVAVVATAIILVFKYTDSQFVLGVFGFAAAIITASFQYRAAKDKETEARLFTQKQGVYSDLINMLMGMFHAKKTSLTDDEQAELISKLRQIRTQLLIWGSSATLLALDKMSALQEQSPLPINGTKWMSELFAAIRKDLGHRDPHGASLEMALGMLNEPDRSVLRAAIQNPGEAANLHQSMQVKR